MNDNEMADSTRELLNAHHAAILRELDRIHVNVSDDLAGLRRDSQAVGATIDTHTRDDAKQFAAIERGLSVLQWAYGLGVFVLAVLLAKLGWTP